MCLLRSRARQRRRRRRPHLAALRGRPMIYESPPYHLGICAGGGPCDAASAAPTEFQKRARARESRVTVTSISLGANASASVGARVFCPWASSFARPIGHICRNKGNQWPLTPPRVSCSADEGERYFGLFASPPHTHAIAFVTVGIPCLADDGGIQSVSLACRFQSVTL